MKAFLNKLAAKNGTIARAYFVPSQGKTPAQLLPDTAEGAYEVSVVQDPGNNVIIITPKKKISGLEKQLKALIKLNKTLLNGYELTSIAPRNNGASADETETFSGLMHDDDDDDDDAFAKAKSDLTLRFSAWLTGGGRATLDETEVKLRRGFAEALKAGNLKNAAAYIAALEKMAAKYAQEQATAAEGAYAPMPGAPAGGDDTYDKMPGAPAGGDDTYAKMPEPPAGGDDGHAPLRDDDDDFEVDRDVRDDLVQQFVTLTTRLKAAEANLANSLHADRNRSTLGKIKAAMEKVRAQLKKKQFVPITVGEAMRGIDKALKSVEKETA